MRAWVVERTAPIDEAPLRRVERDEPQPGAGQVRVRISCCGVCRTDLHLAEGDLPPRRPEVTVGHEIVGTVDAVGEGASRFAIGDRIGVPWLADTDRSCAFCRRGAENLCLHPQFTGWDIDGGYADACLADEAYAYRLPDRTRRRACRAAAVRWHHRLPGAAASRRSGRRAARHLRLRRQRAHHRSDRAAPGAARARAHPRRGNRKLAAELGADSVGGATDAPPEPLDGAILFAPAGELVPVALRALDRGGTLAIAGIWLSDIPSLNYAGRAIRGAAGAQRHRQHPPGRRGVPGAGRAVRHQA